MAIVGCTRRLLKGCHVDPVIATMIPITTWDGNVTLHLMEIALCDSYWMALCVGITPALSYSIIILCFKFIIHVAIIWGSSNGVIQNLKTKAQSNIPFTLLPPRPFHPSFSAPAPFHTNTHAHMLTNWSLNMHMCGVSLQVAYKGNTSKSQVDSVQICLLYCH